MATTTAAAVRRLETPLQFAATVVTGFKRGSKELGWPTANLENTPTVQAAIEQATLGVYCGWATCVTARRRPPSARPPAHRPVPAVALAQRLARCDLQGWSAVGRCARLQGGGVHRLEPDVHRRAGGEAEDDRAVSPARVRRRFLWRATTAASDGLHSPGACPRLAVRCSLTADRPGATTHARCAPHAGTEV
jgi:hypothetical protein